ncbi:hypothetical protein ACGFNU_39375 [Spirillospora sp. NPDC048911]|uniref:hypothetical protein n=1 Tax=Spirillospora sp. NPDC048911 TaxID=3364527 RepID=UPI003717BF95
MTFDDDYKRTVLEPGRAAGDQPPEDLRVRYALDEPLSPAAVAARVKLVRQCWRRARGQLKYRKLIDRLEAEHRELAPLFTAAERGDPRPLAERLRGGQEATRRRTSQARARLADAAGMLRMVTPGEVEDIARAGGVTRAELESVAGDDRIEIREPDELPATPPYAAYRKVRESLDVLGRRHLPDFLFGERLAGPMRVLDGFSVPVAEGGPLRLDAAAVTTVAARWARRSRDTSLTHADTVLAALRSTLTPQSSTSDQAQSPTPANPREAGVDLTELVLYDLAERLRERRRQRASERALLRHALEDLGIEPGDARRLVFAVLRETGPGGGVAARLRALLDGGEVHAAAELAGAAGEDDGEEAGLLAAEARQRVATAVRLREAAAAERDPDTAWRLLADALQLVGDLPGAAEHQRRLPPRPVPSLSADIDGDTDGDTSDDRGTRVRLSWPPSPSTAGELLYHVVRRRDRPPRNAADGEALPGPRDDRPPVNVPLYYGVVAVRGEAAAAPAVAGPVIVRPEPREIELLSGDGVVTGRWRCPPEAARALVVRDGKAVAAGREGFQERVPNGVVHHYRICAVYLDADGREAVTPGVRVSATPSAPPEPVYELTAEPDPSDPGSLLVRFEPPRHGTVELVLTTEPPPWPRSALVPVDEVRQVGRRVAATPARGGLAVRPGAGGWLVAVSVAGGVAAIGAYHRHVNLPPPRRVLAERRGAFVHVGFDWPADVAEIELTYRIGPDESATGRIVTRAAYDTQGGIRIAVPEDQPVELHVAAAGTVGGARVTGPAVSAEVTGRTVVSYDVERGGPPWRRALTIRLSAARPLRVARLELVLRTGRVMPHRASDGETVASWEEIPVPGEVSLPLPQVSGPYWLRCFADDDVIELSDPPVRRLQVTR